MLDNIEASEPVREYKTETWLKSYSLHQTDKATSDEEGKSETDLRYNKHACYDRIKSILHTSG